MELVNMNELENQYRELQTEYTDLANQALEAKNAEALNPILERLTTTNESIRNVLDQMLSALAASKETTPDISAYRDELVQNLRRIQNDYNNLKSNTDRLETLRRIRAYEESKATGSLNWYLLGFLALCVVLLIFMIVFGRQRSSDATYAMAASPAMTPPLM